MRAALFDTNIVIDYSRGIENAAIAMNSYHYKMINIVTWIEYLAGVPESRLKQQQFFLKDSFEIFDFSAEAAEETILIRKQHRMKLPDAMIYGTARAEKLTLVTRNTKDFNPDWPDIHVPYQI